MTLRVKTLAETVLYAFPQGVAGSSPEASVLEDSFGNLYSTALYGGSDASGCPGIGRGVLFRLSPSEAYSIRYEFMPATGFGPLGAIVGDPAANIYGVASEGTGNSLYGAVYRLDPAGAYSVLHAFGSAPGDRRELRNGLFRNSHGNLFGTSFTGGKFGGGTLYKVTPEGAESILHNFEQPSGRNPWGEVTGDAAGNLYGTTFNGDGNDNGEGVVFKLDTSEAYSVVYAFNFPEGNPIGRLYLDLMTGDVYGSGRAGGSGSCGNECGIVFKFDPATGIETTLYTFTGSGDGSISGGGLVGQPSPDGSELELYGSASGGANSSGVVFKLVVSR